jgi:hypothetical protein
MARMTKQTDRRYCPDCEDDRPYLALEPGYWGECDECAVCGCQRLEQR